MTTLRQAGGLLLLSLVVAVPLAAQKATTGSRQTVPEARQRCWGSNPNAPVLIEVFSDFQCPACRQLYLETIRPVLADYAIPGKVCVTYYEFPLRNHKHSRLASRYAHASLRLGPAKWVQVTDALFSQQAQWADDGRVEAVVARAVSPAEMSQLRKWAADPQLNAIIDRDLARGNQRGINQTPTMFITANGKTDRVSSVVQYAVLRRYLDSLLASR